MVSKFFAPARMMLGALLLLSGLLAACGDTATPTAPPPTPAPATATTTTAGGAATTPATGAAGAIAVTLKEWAIEPATIDVPAGHVTFNVTNSGKFPHNFKIVVNGQQVGTPNISPGQSMTWETDLTAGSYDTLCAIPGHKDQGMAGKITVK
jgi:uncharacterized cupredoxin-like copper-binding protein